MKKLEQVIVSKIAPRNINVLWVNPDTNETFYWNNEWILISGSGGGSGFGNVLVGTKDEREALSGDKLYNGLVFNQVEEDGTVHRYFYEKNEWVLLANPDLHDTEEVIFNIQSDDDTLDLGSLTIKVENKTTQTTHDVDIDSIGEGIIYIPIGETYRIIFPEIEHYFIDTYMFEYTAERYIRTINIKYRHSYSDFETVAKSFILKEDGNTAVETGGSDVVLNRIIDGGREYPGTYVIDERNKKFARLDPTDHGKFLDGTVYTGVYGNVFRHFPKVYLLRDKTYSGIGTKYWISDVDFSGEDTPYVMPESWIGVYKGNVTDNKLYSRPNLQSTGGITIANFQSYAQYTGVNYGIMDYKDRQKIIALAVAKYGTTNSDEIATAGMAISSNSTSYNVLTGATISLGDATGHVPYPQNGYPDLQQVKLFGIEALWGQQWEFLKGIYFKSSVSYVYDSNTYTTEETPERTFPRLTRGSGSYVTNLVLGDCFDIMPRSAENGSSTTYYCDAYWGASGHNLLYVGGASNCGFISGLFSCPSHAGFSSSTADRGARLCFYGDISEYELVTGEELKSLNL